MPAQSMLRLIKRWRRYERRGESKYLLHRTRGVYVLYKECPPQRKKKTIFEVVYIGVAGIAKKAKTGIGGRLRQHDKSKRKKAWTHYSFFEVHDNVSREEIRELESLLLAVFRHDPRIQLGNKQTSSRALWQLKKDSFWTDVRQRI